ncbi:MAG: tetratricopeptide repeat protein [Candidatus Omnitrophica bacterium]|nr:tetratricopeptide repeat protein [Candidatus Omnitrophota bacterium]
MAFLRRIFLPAVLILLLAPACQAEDDLSFRPDEVFEAACNSYASSDFKAAVKGYEEIIEHGYESANTYYDLGNSYFKLGNLGKAVLNYERAKRLTPRDSALRSNLKYARSLIEQPPMDTRRIWLMRRARNLFDYFSIDALTIFLSLVYMIIILLLIVLIFLKGMRGAVVFAAGAATIILLLGLTLLTINIYKTEHVDSAIVLKKELGARFEPRADGIVHFKIYEGANICVIRHKGSWSQIKREDGKIGWVKASSYEII